MLTISENLTLLFFSGSLLFAITLLLLWQKWQRAQLRDITLVSHVLICAKHLIYHASSVYKVPPLDGPSTSETRFSSPDFSCTLSDPSRWDIDGLAPKHVRCITGELRKVTGDVRAVLLLEYRDFSAQKLNFEFHMDDHANTSIRAARGLHYHITAHNHDGATKEIVGVIKAKEIARHELDSFFHSMFTSSPPNTSNCTHA